MLVSGALSGLLKDVSGSLSLHLRSPLPEKLAADWRERYGLHEDGGARYILNLPDVAQIAQALEAARAAGCEPIALRYGQRDLEQLFMQLTDRSLRD